MMISHGTFTANSPSCPSSMGWPVVGSRHRMLKPGIALPQLPSLTGNAFDPMPWAYDTTGHPVSAAHMRRGA